MNSKLLTGFLSFLMGLNTALLIMILIRLEQQPAQQSFQSLAPQSAAQMITLPSFENEALALSGPQRRQIARIKERWASEEQARQLRVAERTNRMPEVFMGEDLSMDAVQPLMDQAHEDSRNRMEMMMGLFREYQEVLTPEQQRQFRTMLHERHQMMRDARNMGGRRDRGDRRGPEMRPRSDRRERFQDGPRHTPLYPEGTQ